MDVSESEGDSIPFQNRFAVSRHFQHLAQEALVPEIAAAYEKQAAAQHRVALDAMPPSQLVSHLEGRVKAKLAEADRLQKQFAEAKLRFHNVSLEGTELLGQLEEAKAKQARKTKGPKKKFKKRDP